MSRKYMEIIGFISVVASLIFVGVEINQNTNATLASISRKFIVFTTESKIPYVFDKLIKEREHISLIIDKKKEVKGIVTMEDIIETLLGYEIMDETDTIEDMQAYAKKRMQNMNL